MHRYKSRVNVRAPEFAKNTEAMNELVNDMNGRLVDWQSQGSKRRQREFRKRGKLLARERLDLLLDQDSPFLEIGGLVGESMEDQAHGNSMITGIGLICGQECMIVANVPTVGKGAMDTVNGAKWMRASQISTVNKLPFIQLLESAGADLSMAFKVFHSAPSPFAELAQRSRDKVPNICIVFGTCIAGGAYMAGMSDYVIMVKGQAQLALAGSPLVKVATGEDSTDEELGGATLHAKESGVTDYLVKNEHQALKKCREVVATLPSPTRRVTFPRAQQRLFSEPFYNPEEILGICSPTAKGRSMDVREIMARIVDGSVFSEFKPEYGSSLVTAWSHVYGVPVGLIGNNGILFHESAQKAAHFINLCNQKGYPIIFLHNVTGFMVGRKYEKSGMIKWGSQMINAVSNSRVPVISFILGASFGAANFAMAGRGFFPRFVFSWPNAECHVMGPDQLAGVLDIVARKGAEKKGRKVNEEMMNTAKAMMAGQIREEMAAMHYTGHGIDDGVIDPRRTREVAGMCLSVISNADIPKTFIDGLSRL